MLNDYLKYVQEDDQQLNEFIMLPVIILATKAWKKYYNHKQMSKFCKRTEGIERKKCFINYKIKALTKTYKEVKQFKIVCKKWSENVPKCLTKVDKQLAKLAKDIQKQKQKLAKL